MSQKRPNRYPDVQPFQKEQAHLFFGCDDDTERLYDLILLEKLVGLFGKSGYGESSLLNAGILPLLEKETANGKRKYVPVRVRFNTWSEQGETLFTKFIFPLVSPLQENTHPRRAVSLRPDNIPETLWSRLKFSRPTPDTDFVLIFDQFEEFFTCQTFSKCQCISQGKTLCRCLACLHRSYATKPKATRKKRDEHPTQHHEKRKNTADFERNRDLGLFLIENKQYRAALRYLSDALRAKPDDSTLTNAMNECIFKTGQQ